MDENTKVKDLEIADEFLMSDSQVKGKIIAKKLRKLGDGGVVLITEQETEVVGFIRKKEIVELVATGENPAKMFAAEIMNTDYVEVLEDETLGNILPIISQSYPNAIVVIADDRKCVGFFSENDYKEAMATLGYYDERSNPETAEDWRLRGIAMSSRGDSNEAINCYEKAVDRSANKKHAWEDLAKRLEKLNKLKDAIKCYDKAVTIDSKDDKALTERGKLFSKGKTNNLAIQSYNLALTINPKNTEAMISLGLEYLNQGNTEKAIEHFNEAETIDGESADLWFKKGSAYDKAENYEKALDSFEKAIKIDEKYEEAWFNKSVILHKMGDDNAALDGLKHILKINPDNESVKEAIASFEKDGKFNFF